MNQRKWGTILSYVYIVVTNTISIIYTPYMLNMMGQSEYGLYGTASSFISYLSILNFGIGGAYIKFNAQARASADKEAEAKFNGMFLTIFTLLAILVFICGIVLIVFAGTLVKNTYTVMELFKLRIIMFILILNMMVTFICNVFMMALNSYEKFIVIRITLLIAGIVNPIINIYALKIGGKSITITMISFIVSIVTYMFFFIYAKKSIHLRFVFREFDKQLCYELFVFSGYLFLNTITDQITFSTDNIILSAVKGTAATAVYTVASSFKNYFMYFSTSVSGVFSPMVNHIVVEKKYEELDNIFIKVGRIQFYVLSLVLIGFILLGYDFIKMWAGEDYIDAYWIAILLFFSVYIPCFQNIGIEIQKAKNMHKVRSIVYFFVALFNIFLTIPFSKLWSGIGAALATMVCMFLGQGLFMNWYYQKYIKLDMKRFWLSIFSIIPGYIVPILVGILIKEIWIFNSFFDILLGALLISITYFVSIWLISMNDYEKNLIKRPIKKLLERNV